MLATMVEALHRASPRRPDAGDQVHGFRALAAVRDARSPCDAQRSTSASASHRGHGAGEDPRAEVVIDGEIVVLDEAGVSRFKLLAGGEAARGALGSISSGSTQGRALPPARGAPPLLEKASEEAARAACCCPSAWRGRRRRSQGRCGDTRGCSPSAMARSTLQRSATGSSSRRTPDRSWPSSLHANKGHADGGGAVAGRSRRAQAALRGRSAPDGRQAEPRAVRATRTRRSGRGRVEGARGCAMPPGFSRSWWRRCSSPRDQDRSWPSLVPGLRADKKPWTAWSRRGVMESIRMPSEAGWPQSSPNPSPWGRGKTRNLSLQGEGQGEDCSDDDPIGGRTVSHPLGPACTRAARLEAVLAQKSRSEGRALPL